MLLLMLLPFSHHACYMPKVPTTNDNNPLLPFSDVIKCKQPFATGGKDTHGSQKTPMKKKLITSQTFCFHFSSRTPALNHSCCTASSLHCTARKRRTTIEMKLSFYLSRYLRHTDCRCDAPPDCGWTGWMWCTQQPAPFSAWPPLTAEAVLLSHSIDGAIRSRTTFTYISITILTEAQVQNFCCLFVSSFFTRRLKLKWRLGGNGILLVPAATYTFPRHERFISLLNAWRGVGAQLTHSVGPC